MLEGCLPIESSCLSEFLSPRQSNKTRCQVQFNGFLVFRRMWPNVKAGNLTHFYLLQPAYVCRRQRDIGYIRHLLGDIGDIYSQKSFKIIFEAGWIKVFVEYAAILLVTACTYTGYAKCKGHWLRTKKHQCNLIGLPSTGDFFRVGLNINYLFSSWSNLAPKRRYIQTGFFFKKIILCLSIWICPAHIYIYSMNIFTMWAILSHKFLTM